MSTNNFCYEHRCIVVPDDEFFQDADCGSFEDCFDLTDDKPYDDNRSYYRRVLEVKEQLEATQVVITAGYYGDSCLDYIQDEDKAYDSITQVMDWNDVHDYDDKIKRKAERLLKREAKIANKILNRLKREYRLTEIVKVGRRG